MDVELTPKTRERAQLWDVDAFCGPCFHNAMEHTPIGACSAPLCWECPGSKPDYDSYDAYAGVQAQWWDIPGGDPSLEGFVCDKCPADNQPEPMPK